MVPDGVPYLPSSNLLISATTGMILGVGAGFGFKDGYLAWETTDTTITCTSSASEQTLYISARLDTANNTFTGGKVDKYTTFVAATDICFAIVVIPANAVTITAGMITDVRSQSAYCGYITDQREYLEALILEIQNELATVIGGGMPDHAATHAVGGDDPLTGYATIDANSKVTASEASSYINSQSDSYTIVLGDAGKLIKMTKATASNLTVPPNSSVAFPTGTEIEVLEYGAGQVTIVAGSGVTLRSAASALKIAAQYASVSLKKLGTDEWAVVGYLTA